MTFSHKLMLSAAVVAIFGATMVADSTAQAQTAEFKTKQAGDFLIRGRVIGVVPPVSYTHLTLPTTPYV